VNRKAAIGLLVVAALIGVAVLSLDVRIRMKDAQPAGADWSPTKPYPAQDAYYPGTEALASDEMRVIACGTGMPMPRLKQAAACFIVELGNGDKFIFDMGAGSAERIAALGIPYDYLDKVFLGHLHIDHAGDFPEFVFSGGVMNRLTPVRVWGPTGIKPGWGTKAWWQKIREAWVWEETGRAAATDPRSSQVELTEFDWRKINNLVYDDNDVEIRTIPAIHADQAASFLLEWNGLKFAFSSDTMPNRYWLEHTKGFDLVIHEAVLPPEAWREKYGFPPANAVYVSTQVHTTPEAFGKMMSMTEPRMAVAYHFQNDTDTQPMMLQKIRKTYDGPLSLATDFMVWNVTKEGIRTRMAVPSRETYMPPPQRPRMSSIGELWDFDPVTVNGPEPETVKVTNEVIKAFNEKYGTDVPLAPVPEN